MEFTRIIYRKGDKWYKTYTEVPDYDEKRFLEIYDDREEFNMDMDKLLEYINRGWGKVASCGLHEWCDKKNNMIVTLTGHELENIYNSGFDIIYDD